MKLGRKNLAYSMTLAGIMLLFLVGYFIYMLPSLYVDHRMEENLRSIREQHSSYVKDHSYENVRVSNSAACYSLEIPKEGNRILIAGKAFSAELIIKDERIYEILERCREKLAFSAGNPEKEGAVAELKEDFGIDLEEEAEAVAKIFQETVGDTDLLVELKLLYHQGIEDGFFGESVRWHYYSGNLVVMEASISDADNHYTNYVAVEQTDKSLIMSYLPVLTPGMDEIRPVVLQSLPMLGAVVWLLVLLFSQLYSKGIVNPLETLVRHTKEMKASGDFSVERLSGGWQDRKDEIGELAETLDNFYLQIRDSYRELEEENKRQEVFLRASSHQLKTPIAAALLLVDGMINEVGRYKDTRCYLPKVKQQLLSMRKMVEDILYLNHCAENISFKQVDVGKLLEERTLACRIVLADRKLRVDYEQNSGLTAYTDELMLQQIVDNLLSNSIRYTPEGGHIRISLQEGKRVRIENYGVRIPEELLPHVMEPFVSSSHGRDSSGARSHGLGLYIASYYAKKLGLLLSVSNGKDSVAAELTFPAPSD